MDELYKKVKPLPCAVCGKPNTFKHDCYAEAQAEIDELVEMLIRFHRGAYSREFDIDEEEVIKLITKHREEDW